MNRVGRPVIDSKSLGDQRSSVTGIGTRPTSAGRVTVCLLHSTGQLIAAPEPVIVGLAAAVYPATYAGTEASIDETQEFLDAYMSARARSFSDEELEEAWAAGLWNEASTLRSSSPPKERSNR